MAVAIIKDEIWPILGYDPHPGQKAVHDCLVRNRVLAGGRRWGKSKVGGHELIPCAARSYAMRSYLEEVGKSHIYWIGGPDYTDGEKEFRHLWNGMRKMQFPFDKPGTYNNPLGGDMHISLWDGRFQVHVKSAKYPDSWDGEGLAGILLVEAAKLKALMYHKYVRPSLADERGWPLMTSTPEGKNWFYKMWQRGQDPSKPTWASWRMPSWSNTALFPGGRDDPEILSMIEDMSEERVKQEIEADFTEFVGRVFKDFDEEVHVKDLEYDPRLPLYGACDYGWTNPFVWLAIQVDVWDNVYVLGEYRCQRKDINDIAADLTTWRDGLAYGSSTFYPDPAEPGDTAILEKRLRVKADTSTGGPLKWRLEQIRRWLKLYPEEAPFERRRPKLFLDRSCSDTIWEMSDGYRYPATKEESTRSQPEEPMDKDNHGPEALGRFFRGHYGSEDDDDTGGSARVSQAVMSRG